MCATAIVAMSACSPDQNEPVVYHAAYPLYGSVTDLTEAADLVIVATVLSSEVQVLNILSEPDGTGNPDTNPQEGGTGEPIDGEGEFVYTVYQLLIAEVISGDVVAGETIEAAQLGGGSIDGTDYVEASTEYLAIDETYALFLSDYENSPAKPISNTQAVYLQQDDESSFESLSDDNPIAEEVVVELENR